VARDLRSSAKSGGASALRAAAARRSTAEALHDRYRATAAIRDALSPGAASQDSGLVEPRRRFVSKICKVDIPQPCAGTRVLPGCSYRFHAPADVVPKRLRLRRQPLTIRSCLAHLQDGMKSS
jgi:hypothetical protein